MSNVLVVGDIHGCFDNLLSLIKARQKKTRLDAVIVCGDYGIWTDFKKEKIPAAYNVPYPCPVYFVDGNHENHHELDKYERGKIHNIIGNLYFCAYGSVLTINKTKFLFCGGAASIDKGTRIPFKTWWPTECISESDTYFLPDEKIDIVISHTAPSCVCKEICEQNKWSFDYAKSLDKSIAFLDNVLETYQPQRWYFGHWHTSYYAKKDLTKFIGLDTIPFVRKKDFNTDSCESCYTVLCV